MTPCACRTGSSGLYSRPLAHGGASHDLLSSSFARASVRRRGRNRTRRRVAITVTSSLSRRCSSGICRGLEPSSQLRPPADVPLHQVDPVPEHLAARTVDGTELVLDGPEELRRARVVADAALHELAELRGLQQLTEEEPQQCLVAHLERIARLVQPFVERLSSSRCQLVDTAAHSPARRLRSSNEPPALEPAELRIDLPVARPPEEARGAVGNLLDVVPRARTEGEKSEDDPCRGGQA